jgi:hypothetical protein
MSRQWDLQGAAARLDLAFKTFLERKAEIEESWNDDAYKAFHANRIEPMEPRLRAAMAAIRRLSEYLDRMETLFGDQDR